MRISRWWLMAGLMMCRAAWPSEPLIPGNDQPPSPNASHLPGKHTKALPFPGLRSGFPGGVIEWYYNPAGVPPALAATAQSIIEAAAQSWSSVCAVRFIYKGTATQHMAWDGRNVISWNPVAYGPWGQAAAYYGNAGVMEDADIELHPALDAQGLYSVVSHEWGHALGLTHSDKDGALMSGPPLSAYTAFTVPQADDIAGCRALYDDLNCATPKPAALVYDAACEAPLTGTRTLSAASSCVNRAWQFDAPTVVIDHCAVPSPIVAAPAPPPVSAPVATAPVASPVVPPLAPPVAISAVPPVVVPIAATHVLKEYYRADNDDYFYTADPVEQQQLQVSGSSWRATGFAWGTWMQPAGTALPVCRFYGDWTLGLKTGTRLGPDTHFFTAHAAECKGLSQRFPEWIEETGAAFYMELAVDAVCGNGRTTLSRWFRPWGAPVHRYTSSVEAAASTAAQGWVPEGPGFCAPPPA